MLRRLLLDTPCGPLTVAATDGGVPAIRSGRVPSVIPVGTGPLLEWAAEELRHYFRGELRRFTFPVEMHGTPFQRSVWEALRTIPYGETRTYGQIAALIGHPRAARAVGMANHRNPLCLVVPCHRVVGAGGGLTGYAGGLEIKRRLLALEQARLPGTTAACDLFDTPDAR